jgi:molybdate transport system substrate-binding protein
MKQAIALAAIALVAASCGGSGGRLTVYAASSLTQVFQQLDPKARFNFAGSDQLAFQIEQGAMADVYASASTKYPDRLAAKGLAEPPRVFATNTLVLIVPRANPARIDSLGSLMKAGVKLVLAAPGVPAGDYARKALERFCKSIFVPAGTRCPRAKVVSEEPDVKGVVAKIALDEADAGFVYATDARAAGGKVQAISVPVRLQPAIRYSIAVLRHAPHHDSAERFVRLVLGSSGRAALRRAGFGVP